MKPPPPVPPAVPPASPRAPGSATLVGGLPWEQEESAASTAPVVGAPIAIDRPAPPPNADDIDLLSWPSIKRRIEGLVRRSPPLTVSVVLHAVALLALALWIVRDTADKPVPIALAFASPTVVEAEEKGVEIPPEPEPVDEPETEEVKTEEPPVEDPAAAPPMVEEVAEAPGNAVAESSAPAVGSLLNGREVGRREALVSAYGGSDVTEAAVAHALLWLQKQQQADGLWSLQGPYQDGGSQENRLAATAMALLAYQGAGNTPDHGKHRIAVKRGWKALLAKQLPDGRFDVVPLPQHHSLYAHAQATIAICELYGMTKDLTYEVPARRALAYAVAAQGGNGAWRYEPRRDGDMSVTGWFLMALKSAEMAGLEVPTVALAGINRFLDSAAVDEGTAYGYRLDEISRPVDDEDRRFVRTTAAPVTAAVSAEGLLCRQYLGWPRNDRRLEQGLERLLASHFLDMENDKDVYAWYYITQVAHHAGGERWDRWNARMREVVPGAQVRRGPETGSWDPALDKWGHIGGRLFTTCFCTYMLEVYYRHLPLYETGH